MLCASVLHVLRFSALTLARRLGCCTLKRTMPALLVCGDEEGMALKKCKA